MKLRKNNMHGLEILSNAPVEFHVLGPVNYKAAGLLTYAVGSEFRMRALANPDVVGIFTNSAPPCRDVAWIVTDDPQADFFRFHNWLAWETEFYQRFESRHKFEGRGIHINARNVVIDNGAWLSSGVIVGEPGARFVYSKTGERINVAHVGGVHICEGAHVGANAVIVKSVWPRPTRIGRNAFIGNLVNVGHNAQVGDEAVILTGVILGGSCVIGEGATVGLGAIIRPHVTVGAGAVISMGSVVTQDVPEGARVTGNFAIEHGRFLDELRGER